MNPQTYHCDICSLDIPDPMLHVSSDAHKANIPAPQITEAAPVVIDPLVDASRAQAEEQPVVVDAPKPSGAQQGNNNGEKFKTPEARSELLRLYCEHMAQGFSKESFRPCDMQTFKHYREKYPLEFDTEIIQAAEREGMYWWENIGRNGTIGLPIRTINAKGEAIEISGKYNSDSWKFNMQNRFKWKINTDVTTDGEKLQSPTVIIDTKESS